jgi:opacity protein-like surface antigen
LWETFEMSEIVNYIIIIGLVGYMIFVCVCKYTIAFNFDDPAADGHSGIFDNAGLSVSIEDQFPGAFNLFCFSLDWLLLEGTETLANGTVSFTDNSFILGAALGYPLFRIFTLYAGGGLGFTMRGYGSYMLTNGSEDDIPDSRTEFAWKVNGGLRLQFSSFFAKFDVSYGTILGPAFGIGIGLFM